MSSYPTLTDKMIDGGWFASQALGVGERDELLTLDDGFERALGWTALEAPVINGHTFDIVPGKKVLYRSDNNGTLSVTNDTYGVVQNSDVLEILREGLGGLAYNVGAIGSLRGGSRTFVAIGLADAGELNVGGDVLRPWLLAGNSFDGSSPLRFTNIATRPACTNVLSMTLRSGQTVASVRHTSKVGGYLSELRNAVRRFVTVRDQFQRDVQRLIDAELDRHQVATLIDAFAPIPTGVDVTARRMTRAENRRDALTEAYYNDPRVGFTGSAWGFVQAVSTIAQNDSGFRRTENGPADRDERKIEWAIDGGDRERATVARIERTLDLALVNW